MRGAGASNWGEMGSLPELTCWESDEQVIIGQGTLEMRGMAEVMGRSGHPLQGGGARTGTWKMVDEAHKAAIIKYHVLSALSLCSS